MVMFYLSLVSGW